MTLHMSLLSLSNADRRRRPLSATRSVSSAKYGREWPDDDYGTACIAACCQSQRNATEPVSGGNATQLSHTLLRRIVTVALLSVVTITPVVSHWSRVQQPGQQYHVRRACYTNRPSSPCLQTADAIEYKSLPVRCILINRNFEKKWILLKLCAIHVKLLTLLKVTRNTFYGMRICPMLSHSIHRYRNIWRVIVMAVS